MRKPGFQLKNGYVVLAIPDSGLFIKNGKIVTGHETALRFNEMVLFSREFDARQHADRNAVYWKDGDSSGHQWNFEVMQVLVSERL